MINRIVWKYKGQFYTEYEGIEQIKYILDFLEKNINDGFELVSITPNED
jgi:hypothetical protein